MSRRRSTYCHILLISRNHLCFLVRLCIAKDFWKERRSVRDGRVKSCGIWNFGGSHFNHGSQTDSIQPRIFPVSDVVTSLTVILLMTISAVVPVYKTFDFKKIDFQPLEKDAVEEKRLTPEEELNLLLSNEPQRESFVQHLMTEFSVENILFHDAVIVFRKRIEGLENKNEPNDEIWNEATNIWDSFLSDTSENEVNISHSNKTKIVESISKDRTLYAVPPDIFDAAFSEIIHLMAFDSLLRYKKTRKS
eukprot:1126511_1